MCEIDFDTDWNKQSTDRNNDKVHPNHESELTKEDMLLLVAKIFDIEGMKNPPETMHDRFKMLADCYADKGPKKKIVVRKGIHMRDQDVHFTINMPPYGMGEADFEVMLKAVDKSHGANVSPLTKFEYVPVGITTTQKRVVYKWPPSFVYSKRGDHGGIGRPRGNSIGASIGNSGAVDSGNGGGNANF